VVGYSIQAHRGAQGLCLHLNACYGPTPWFPILKKRQGGQEYTAITTLKDTSRFYAYLPRIWRIHFLTAFCPASTAIFGSRQGFATLLETTVESLAFCAQSSVDQSKSVIQSPLLGFPTRSTLVMSSDATILHRLPATNIVQLQP
jgi:hypothetical protein